MFTYAPVIWMFCSKTLSKEIERIHKRALRAVSCDFYSSYETLLISSGCKRIHEIHIYHILCEVYKTLHNLNPSFMQALFRAKPLRYSFRNANLLLLPVAKSQRFALPDSAKSQITLETFKRSLKALNLLKLCTCKICKI